MQQALSENLEELQEQLLTNMLERTPHERMLQLLSPEERVRGLSSEELLRALPAEQFVAGLSAGEAARLRELLERKEPR